MKNNNKNFQINNPERVIYINGIEFEEGEIDLFGWKVCCHAAEKRNEKKGEEE